jgi:hypothetical protein
MRALLLQGLEEGKGNVRRLLNWGRIRFCAEIAKIVTAYFGHGVIQWI